MASDPPEGLTVDPQAIAKVFAPRIMEDMVKDITGSIKRQIGSWTTSGLVFLHTWTGIETCAQDPL